MRFGRRATPGAQAARARPPRSTGRRVCCGIPAGRLLPWRRPASTAIISGRLPIAKSEIAGPLRIPGRIPCACSLPARETLSLPIPGSPTRSRIQKLKKFTRCDLLHMSPARPGLNLRNGPENLPILVRSAGRPQDRLRLDRYRRRLRPDRADLSHPDLIQR